MAQKLNKERLCYWNSSQDRPLKRGDPAHSAGARFIVYQDDGSRIELCQECAELPRFKNAQKYPIPTN